MGIITKYWPKEEIIKALQELPKDISINKKTIVEYSKKGLMCNASVIPRKFGSLKNACDIAGIRCDALYGEEKTKHMADINIIYTKEKLKEILKIAYEKYGKISPSELVLNINTDNNCDIRSGIKRLYGTIDKALLDVGIDYKNYYWTNERILETLKQLNQKYGPLYKVQISDFRQKNMLCGAKLIRDRFGSVENAAKICGFTFVEPQDVGHLFNGKISKTETEVLDNLEYQFNIKIIRQHRVEIENIVYFFDGYDRENNVVYEVDDKYHSYDKQKILDNVRDRKVREFLHCQIIRIRNY